MPAASDFDLRNLAGPQGEDNHGGLTGVWYAYAADLLDFPALGPLAIAQLELRPGAVWYALASTRDTARYKQTPKDLGRHGQSFSQKLVGVLARHSGELAAGLEALDGQALVALIRDRNDQVLLLGTPEQPLAFTDPFDSGQDFTTRNNYDWALTGETPRRARPYLGTWVVAGDQAPAPTARAFSDGFSNGFS